MENSNKITAYNISSTLIIKGLTFFTAPIISRLLGTANYGIASICVTWATIVATIFGLETYCSIPLAKDRFSKDEQPKFLSSILSLSLLCCFILASVVLLFLQPISHLLKIDSLLVVLLLIYGIGIFLVNFQNAKNIYDYKAKNNFFLSLIVSLSTILLSILLIFIFPKEINHYGRLIGLAAPYLIIGVVIIVLLFKNGKTLAKKDYWLFCLPVCAPMVIHDLSGIILNQCDRIMLQNFLDESHVGLYSLAFSFVGILTSFSNALNNSWVPYFYDYSSKGELSILRKRTKYCLECFTIASICFMLIAPEIYHIFASKDYWDGTSLIPVFVIGAYMVFLYSFPVNHEIFNKQSKNVALGTIAAALINIGLNFLLIPKFGLIGAAIATGFSHLLQFLIHYISAKFFIKNGTEFPYSFRLFAPYIFIFLLMCLYYYFLNGALARWVFSFLFGSFELYRIFKRKLVF